MAAPRNRELEKQIRDLLESPVRTKDDLAHLFCKLLGFEYVSRALSSRDKDTWGAGDAARFAEGQRFEILAQHGDIARGGFAIVYAEFQPFSLSIQRTLVQQLLKRFPAALFLFAQHNTLGSNRGARVHLVHPKVSGRPVSGDLTSQRLILRRFRIGPGERYRTAAERLAKLDLNQRPETTTMALAKICDEAFDKEALTGEFFKRLDKHIRDIEKDLRANETDLTPQEAFTQAQLLVERLVFLYFAQNRGWLDQNPIYLTQHFHNYRKDTDGFGYYREFLHKLFRSLAEPSFGERLEGIPFLNGGLFDDDEFRLESSKLHIRNATFAALFDDLLEAYNFTVREDTPLSQEVAVDPEMLGKIFESIVLHAEAAGEEFQAPDKRKATGSYYTPRIVVHFICRETLRLYFVNRAEPLADGASRSTWVERLSRLFKEIEPDDGFSEDDLKTLRACLSPAEAKRCLEHLHGIRTLDPAVGSGAFPVGLLHELVSLRRVFECAVNGYQDPIKGEGSLWKQEAKEDFIQASLFGVDIQQQAIEICRLRLWLSLLVDYELGVNPFEAERSKFLQAIASISQLPNLEMNFRRGDSLHDYICGHPVRLDLQASAYANDLAAIEKLGQELHQAKRAEKKKRVRLEILGCRLALGQRIVSDQIKANRDQVHNLGAVLFSQPGESDHAKQERLETEIVSLRAALKQLEKDVQSLQRLQFQQLDKTFYRNLRKLEGAEPDGPHNFAWRLDFPHVLAARAQSTVLGNLLLVNEAGGQRELIEAKTKESGGFDLIVGNPPFVTARNPEKRELYRKRWPRVCHMKFLLICPFFELSFGLLRSGGQLGFIVSNAFAKREFGQPLIADFFPTVDLQKVVDCSGLLFPGHGTPTCIVFGAQRRPDDRKPIRVAATMLGGGDLRTPPEESSLWHTLAAQHDNPGFESKQVVVSDRDRKELAEWPWNFDRSADETRCAIEQKCGEILRDFLLADIGFDAITAANDIFMLPRSAIRRLGITHDATRSLLVGELLRNYQPNRAFWILWPYAGAKAEARATSLVRDFLKPFRSFLEIRSQFHKTQLEAGLQWFEFREYHRRALSPCLTYAKIATHIHATFSDGGLVFNEHAPVVELAAGQADSYHLIASILNSSAALLWLKQICFNKGAGEEEQRDRFEFQPGKVQKLPIPRPLAEKLRGKGPALAERLTALSYGCWERGQKVPTFALLKLFEKSGEAYHTWNAALPGYLAPNAELGKPFASAEELQNRFFVAVAARDRLCAEMIALQEEMDWLVYGAYGLLSLDAPAVQAEIGPAVLDQGQRPFRIWASAEGDFTRAVQLIPADWPESRRALWKARLAAIRDNEHIRRIEQPVYKRRWDEQWKVSNRWMSGAVAYAQEFVDAFRWWLAEKAEWHLEHKVHGGPLRLDAWCTALWRDPRTQAAWPLAAECIHRVDQWKFDASEKENRKEPKLDDSREAFAKFLKGSVTDESVPNGIPPALSWDDLAAKKKWTPTELKKAEGVRGKLNVPRERFHTIGNEEFVWAGKPSRPQS